MLLERVSYLFEIMPPPTVGGIYQSSRFICLFKKSQTIEHNASLLSNLERFSEGMTVWISQMVSPWRVYILADFPANAQTDR